MRWLASSLRVRSHVQSSALYRAEFSTSTCQAAKARRVSDFTKIGVAIKRVLARGRDKPEWPQARTLLHGVHGLVNSTPVFASAASETSINVISEALARSCDLNISPLPEGDHFLLPNGQDAEPVGTTVAEWSFKGEISSKITIDFTVMDSPSRSVILGAEVLQRTRTFDINWHRLQTVSGPAEDFSCVHIFGDLSNSIAGRLDSTFITALAATGSEVNLVSPQFAEEHESGLNWRRPLEDHWLKLIDGSYVPINRTIVLNWQYGDEWKRWPAEFVVFPDLPCDVVLGQQFLYGSGAFFRYADCFKASRPTNCRAGVERMPNILKGLLAGKAVANAVKYTVGDQSHHISEARFRISEINRISRLPDAERKFAEDAEHRRRALWSDNSVHNNTECHTPSEVLNPAGLNSPVDEKAETGASFSMTTTNTASPGISHDLYSDSDSDVIHDP